MNDHSLKKVKKMSEKIINKNLKDSGNPLLKRLLLISLPAMLITSTLVILIIGLSNYPGTMNDTQLGFNAEIIKNYFALMSSEEILFFILANLVDYAFMITYGIFFYSSAKYLSRNYRIGSIYQKFGTLFAQIGVLTAICDAIENVFLLSMTADPMGFPSWLAIAHSSFALLKFILMYSTVAWLFLSFMLNKIPFTLKMIEGRVTTDPVK